MQRVMKKTVICSIFENSPQSADSVAADFIQSEDGGVPFLHNSQLTYFALSYIHLLGLRWWRRQVSEGQWPLVGGVIATVTTIINQ